MGTLTNFLGDLKVLAQAATQKPPGEQDPGSVAHLIEDNAKSMPEGIALICEDEVVTWRELNERANRVANVLKSQGINRGDTISLFMQNRIEFVVQIVAISKLGAAASLINTNLTRQPLEHCISLTGSRKCIFGEELTEPLNEIRESLDLEDGVDYLYVADTGETPPPNWAVNINSTDTQHPHENHPETAENVHGETAFYIFTSGTTGLPKAAVVSSRRLLPTALMSANALARLKPTDRVYNCLPLYHGTGLMIGMIAAFHAGAATVIKRRLSVSAFWDDIQKHNCTSFVYIGEFIRYIMSRPETPEDANNPVRTIVGNGLRPDIWL